MTILTIDDEENIRNGLADNFELEGYDVKQAASGEEGLKIVSEGGIDLVITDLRMDGISGEEVVRQVTTIYPGILTRSGIKFLSNEIIILENINTAVVVRPIPAPLIADVVTASVGHIPSISTKVGFSLIIPLTSLSTGFVFILFTSFFCCVC